MSDWLIRAGLLIAGLIHCLPLAGASGAEALQRMYGLGPVGAELELLLRHRAILFGLLGALLIAAVWMRALRSAALIAGMVSAVSFLLLAGLPDELGTPLAKVWWADIVAVAALAVAAAAHCFGPRNDSQTRKD